MKSETNFQSGSQIPSQGLTKRPAETPRSVSRPSPERRLKRSTFLGYLLFLQRNRKLSEDQERFLIRLQAKVKLEELTSAIDLLIKISSSERAAARAQSDLELAYQRCGRIPAKLILPEPRRIGVGYRDKGALRPSHHPQEVAPRSWWSQDLSPDLLVQPEEPTWISSEELFGLGQYPEIQTAKGTKISFCEFGKLHAPQTILELILKKEPE